MLALHRALLSHLRHHADCLHQPHRLGCIDVFWHSLYFLGEICATIGIPAVENLAPTAAASDQGHMASCSGQTTSCQDIPI